MLQRHGLTERRHLEVELSSTRQALALLMQQQQQQAAHEAHELTPQAPPSAGSRVLSFQQQSCLVNRLQGVQAELQEVQQQASYHAALAGHLSCVLEQVRDNAQAALDNHSTAAGELRLTLALHKRHWQMWPCHA